MPLTATMPTTRPPGLDHQLDQFLVVQLLEQRGERHRGQLQSS